MFKLTKKERERLIEHLTMEVEEMESGYNIHTWIEYKLTEEDYKLSKSILKKLKEEK